MRYVEVSSLTSLLEHLAVDRKNTNAIDCWQLAGRTSGFYIHVIGHTYLPFFGAGSASGRFAWRITLRYPEDHPHLRRTWYLSMHTCDSRPPALFAPGIMVILWRLSRHLRGVIRQARLSKRPLTQNKSASHPYTCCGACARGLLPDAGGSSLRVAHSYDVPSIQGRWCLRTHCSYDIPFRVPTFIGAFGS